MTALAAQLAVAVENARLHEEAKELGAQLEHALAAEREFARRLRAQYEISHSFTHSLSLEATLEAVTRTMVETLGIDAAAMRLPDGRGEMLETRSVYVSDPKLEALRSILGRDQPATAPPVRRLLRSGEPIVLDRRSAQELGRTGAARALPGAGRDRRGHPGLHPGRGARDADARLPRSCASAARGGARRCPVDRRPGRARRSTTRASTSSRRASRTRCSARCCRAASRG